MEEILNNLPKGTPIYTLCRYESKSGSVGTYDMIIIQDNQPRYIHKSIMPVDTHNNRIDRPGMFCLSGSGFSRSLELVRRLGEITHRDPNYFKQVSL